MRAGVRACVCVRVCKQLIVVNMHFIVYLYVVEYMAPIDELYYLCWNGI